MVSEAWKELARAATGIDVRRAVDVNVLVLSGYGLNCEAETAAAFEMLGATVRQRHVADLIIQAEGGLDPFDGVHMLALVGGFSFGDHVASGRVLANRLRYRLGAQLSAFVDRGGLAIGMCNGFQTMAKLGLLPALDRQAGPSLAEQQVSLVHNDRLGYRDAWVRVGVDEASPCVFTRDLIEFDLPSRHAEGKIVYRDDELRARLEAEHLVPLRYVDPEGRATEQWPANPNGSPGGAAGLCDPTGRIFGLMPHPEAYLYPENHPRWHAQREAGTLPAVGIGLHMLANGVRAVYAEEPAAPDARAV